MAKTFPEYIVGLHTLLRGRNFLGCIAQFRLATGQTLREIARSKRISAAKLVSALLESGRLESLLREYFHNCVSSDFLVLAAILAADGHRDIVETYLESAAKLLRDVDQFGDANNEEVDISDI